MNFYLRHGLLVLHVAICQVHWFDVAAMFALVWQAVASSSKNNLNQNSYRKWSTYLIKRLTLAIRCTNTSLVKFFGQLNIDRCSSCIEKICMGFTISSSDLVSVTRIQFWIFEAALWTFGIVCPESPIGYKKCKPEDRWKYTGREVYLRQIGSSHSSKWTCPQQSGLTALPQSGSLILAL